jgi:hypothetical protein
MRNLLLTSIVTGALVAGSVQGATLFDSFGFESPTYTLGGLAGQNGWTSLGAGVGAVQNSVVQSGSQAVSITGNSANGYWDWQSINYTPSPGEVVSATSGLRRGSSITAIKNFGYFLDAYGSADEIGRIGIAENAGTLVAVATTVVGGTPGNYIFASGLSYDTWYNLQMDINVGSQTFNFSINGTLVGSNLPFLTAESDVTDVDLQLQGRAGATDVGYFDNYKITTVAVPEPAAVSLAVFGGLTLLAVRRRTGPKK